MRRESILRSVRWGLFTGVLAVSMPTLLAQSLNSPKTEKDELFTTVGVTVRRNYIVPASIIAEEGLLKIVVNNPAGVRGLLISLDEDDKKVQIAQKAFDDKFGKTTMYVRASPGRHKIKIGNRAEWVLDLQVIARKK